MSVESDALTSDLRARIVRLSEALATIRRAAANPMKSWDSGSVIDAQRADEEAEEALIAVQECRCGHARLSHGGTQMDCGVELDGDFCACARFAVAT